MKETGFGQKERPLMNEEQAEQSWNKGRQSFKWVEL